MRASYLPLVLFAAFTIIAIAPRAFADTAVTIQKGDSASQACVSAKNCYSPDVVTVTPDSTVTWTNLDSVSHTVTSGNPSDNATGTIFDSSLIKPSTTFSFTFKNAGTYNYFCEVHPWMTGQVIVGAAGAKAASTATAPEFGSLSAIILAIGVVGALAFGTRRGVITKY